MFIHEGEVQEMNEIKVGVVGLGGMFHSHLEHIKKLEGVRIVAVCDIASDVLERMADKLGIVDDKRYQHYADLIADQDVEAVLNVTPNHVHAEIVASCLAHQKPFMTEKPFTRTFEEAYALNELYSKQQVSGMVGYSYRYIASFRYARELLRQGKLGPIRHIFVQYLQSWGVPVYQTPMNWRYSEELSGTGVLADLGTHMVDAARYLVGEFDEVSAVLKNLVSERRDPNSNQMIPVGIDDFSGFMATLEGDVTGMFQTSRNAYGSGNQLEVTLYGELGTISVCCEQPEQLTWIRPNPEDPSCVVRELHRVPHEYVVGQLQDFFDMLRGQGRDGLPVFADGYANQEVLEAIHQAALARRTVELAEFRKDYLASLG